MYAFACTARVSQKHAKAYTLSQWDHVSDSQGLVKNILYITQGFILDAM